MKKNWKMKKLGDIFEIERGGSPRPIDSYLTDSPDGINWIKIGDTKGITKYIYETKEKIKPEGAKRSRIVKEGDFILSNSMSFGKPYIMKTTGCIHDGWLVLRAKEPNIDNDFLYHVLGSNLIYKQFDNLAAGSTVRNLNIDLVKKVEIPLPPLPEQQHIVAILDEAFTAIAKAKENTEKNLQNARELFESQLQSIFTAKGDGWLQTTLGEVTSAILTGPFGSLLHKSDYIENGIPLVNPAHITELGIAPDYNKTVSKETAERLSSYIMRKGDIVLGRRGDMGRCALVTEIEDGWLCGTGSFFIKPSNQCDPRYLVKFLRSDGCKRRLEKIAGGTVMPNLSNTDLSNLDFDLPPLLEQQRIITQLDALSAETKRLESIYKQKLAALEELKKSILQKAFSGKFTANSELTANDELTVPRFIQQEIVWA